MAIDFLPKQKGDIMSAMQLFRIERSIKQVKTLHELGKIPVKEAKKEILRLSLDFNCILDSLAENERGLYQRKIILTSSENPHL